VDYELFYLQVCLASRDRGQGRQLRLCRHAADDAELRSTMRVRHALIVLLTVATPGGDVGRSCAVNLGTR